MIGLTVMVPSGKAYKWFVRARNEIIRNTFYYHCLCCSKRESCIDMQEQNCTKLFVNLTIYSNAIFLVFYISCQNEKRKTNKMKPLELDLVAGVSTFLLLLS